MMYLFQIVKPNIAILMCQECRNSRKDETYQEYATIANLILEGRDQYCLDNS